MNLIEFRKTKRRFASSATGRWCRRTCQSSSGRRCDDKKILKRINRLIVETRRHSFEGIGKPEPLRGDKRGYWSRRITEEHRFVYKAEVDVLKIAQLRYHY